MNSTGISLWAHPTWAPQEISCIDSSTPTELAVENFSVARESGFSMRLPESPRLPTMDFPATMAFNCGWRALRSKPLVFNWGPTTRIAILSTMSARWLEIHLPGEAPFRSMPLIRTWIRPLLILMSGSGSSATSFGKFHLPSTPADLSGTFSEGGKLAGFFPFKPDSRSASLTTWLSIETSVTTHGPACLELLPQVLDGSARIKDARTPNAFLLLPVNSIRNFDGSCDPQAAPLSCQLSVNGPFDGSLGRNTFTQPGTHYENFAFMKNFNLSGLTGRENMKLQCRVEVYNLLNHSNLYLRVDTGNVSAPSFNVNPVLTVPGVVASFGTPSGLPQEARQIVLGMKLIF